MLTVEGLNLAVNGSVGLSRDRFGIRVVNHSYLPIK